MKGKWGNGKAARFRGVALAEAAIVLTVLLIVTMGGIKYGLLLWRFHQMTNAAREGARAAAILDGLPGDADFAAKDVLARGGFPASATVTVNPADFTDIAPGTEVTVTITVAMIDVDYIPDFPLPSAGNLVSSVTMAKEGY